MRWGIPERRRTPTSPSRRSATGPFLSPLKGGEGRFIRPAPMPDLRPLLSPKSVAIVGASGDDHSLRGRLTHYLIEHGFPGPVYPVTRSQSEVLGHKAYAAIADLRAALLADPSRQESRNALRRLLAGAILSSTPRPETPPASVNVHFPIRVALAGLVISA